jgi:hypothetical protein
LILSDAEGYAQNCRNGVVEATKLLAEPDLIDVGSGFSRT